MWCEILNALKNTLKHPERNYIHIFGAQFFFLISIKIAE